MATTVEVVAGVEYPIESRAGAHQTADRAGDHSAAHLRRSSMVHGDIRARNILLTTDLRAKMWLLPGQAS